MAFYITGNNTEEYSATGNNTEEYYATGNNTEEYSAHQSRPSTDALPQMERVSENDESPPIAPESSSKNSIEIETGYDKSGTGFAGWIAKRINKSNNKFNDNSERAYLLHEVFSWILGTARALGVALGAASAFFFVLKEIMSPEISLVIGLAIGALIFLGPLFLYKNNVFKNTDEFFHEQITIPEVKEDITFGQKCKNGFASFLAWIHPLVEGAVVALGPLAILSIPEVFLNSGSLITPGLTAIFAAAVFTCAMFGIIAAITSRALVSPEIKRTCGAKTPITMVRDEIINDYTILRNLQRSPDNHPDNILYTTKINDRKKLINYNQGFLKSEKSKSKI